MLEWVKRLFRKDDSTSGSDKRLIAAVTVLAVFIVGSLALHLHGGTVSELRNGFRFQFSDGAVLAALLIAYVIYRIRKGRNHGG